MTNATGKQSREYDAAELQAIARDAEERKLPSWIARSLNEQAQNTLTRDMVREVNSGRYPE